MPLSDYNGDFNFTIGGNSFRKSSASGGKDVYSRTGFGTTNGPRAYVTFDALTNSGTPIIQKSLNVASVTDGSSGNPLRYFITLQQPLEEVLAVASTSIGGTRVIPYPVGHSLSNFLSPVWDGGQVGVIAVVLALGTTHDPFVNLLVF